MASRVWNDPEWARCCRAVSIPSIDWFRRELAFTVVHRNGVSWVDSYRYPHGYQLSDADHYGGQP